MRRDEATPFACGERAPTLCPLGVPEFEAEVRVGNDSFPSRRTVVATLAWPTSVVSYPFPRCSLEEAR